jgi:hypothetical protein
MYGGTRSYLNAKRGSSGSITIHNFAIFIHQELGKVPFDAVPKKSTLARLQELVNWSSILTIHVNLYRDMHC